MSKCEILGILVSLNQYKHQGLFILSISLYNLQDRNDELLAWKSCFCHWRDPNKIWTHDLPYKANALMQDHWNVLKISPNQFVKETSKYQIPYMSLKTMCEVKCINRKKCFVKYLQKRHANYMERPFWSHNSIIISCIWIPRMLSLIYLDM